jgi:hypothetical protein
MSQKKGSFLQSVRICAKTFGFPASYEAAQAWAVLHGDTKKRVFRREDSLEMAMEKEGVP